LFQTDTGANPGSSGGPVFNIEGQVVGIVVGSPTQVYAGVVYCIPGEICAKYFSAARLTLKLEEVIPTLEPTVHELEMLKLERNGYMNVETGTEYYVLSGDK
jgi:hypothetical protein